MYIHVFFLAGLFAAIRRKYALPVGLVLAHTRTAASRGRLCARPQMGLRAYAGRRVYIHNHVNKSILNI